VTSCVTWTRVLERKAAGQVKRIRNRYVDDGLHKVTHHLQCNQTLWLPPCAVASCGMNGLGHPVQCSAQTDAPSRSIGHQIERSHGRLHTAKRVNAMITDDKLRSVRVRAIHAWMLNNLPSHHY